jgi:hypothetical protein
MNGGTMSEPDLFEAMLATYPAEKRELAREVYHRFADGDSAQFFSQLFLVLDVYAHYAERIPKQVIAAHADSLATMQEIREEVADIARTIEARHASITHEGEKANELCRITQAKCNEAITGIETAVKSISTQVDTQTIVAGIQTTLETGINREVIMPFMRQTEKLAQQAVPTLEQVRKSVEAAETLWSRRIWRTAWTTCLLWSLLFSLLTIAIAVYQFKACYERKAARQIAASARVMQFNQEAFRQLALTQTPIQVLPTPEDGSPAGFVLIMNGAYAADLRPIDGQNCGCIFFHSAVPKNQLRYWPQDMANQGQTTNNPAK